MDADPGHGAPPPPSASSRRPRRGARLKGEPPSPAPSTTDSSRPPGPSGVKQCFRTVKSARRVPVALKPAAAPAPPADRPVRASARTTRSSPPSAASTSTPEAGTSTGTGTGTKRHACSLCGKRFASAGKLEEHARSHTGDLPFSCQRCSKRFSSKFKLVRHDLIHSDERPFACSSCSKTFHRKDHLSNHERVHDPVKKMYTCERPDCRKKYASLLCFRKHAAFHSAEEGALDCKICSETFETRAELVYHLKVHAGSRTVKNETDKKFECDFCNRKFFTGKDVRRHLVVHTGRRDFVCRICEQKFGRKDHLVRHAKKTHPGETWRTDAPDALVPEAVEDEPGDAGPPAPEAIRVKTEDAPKGDAVGDFGVYFEERSAFDPSTRTVSGPIKDEPSFEGEMAIESGYRRFDPGGSIPVDVSEPIAGPSGVSEFLFMVPYSTEPKDLLGDDGSQLATLTGGDNPLGLLDRPVDSMLIGGEGSESLRRHDLFDFGFEPAEGPIPDRPTVLPSFDQVFQNATQNPKPPRRPSER